MTLDGCPICTLEIFFVESALLRIKSLSTEVLEFQLSVPNKLESAGCFGFLHFIFHYVVSGALTLNNIEN